MQSSRLLLPALLVTALLASCAKHSGGQTGDEDALPSGDDFYSGLAQRMGSGGDYQPASDVQQLIEWSDRVVVARAQALRPGRTYVIGTGAKDDQRAETHTAVLELAVERSLKGDDDDALYVQFIVGPEDAVAPSKLPTAQVVVFAKSLAGEDFAPARIEHDGRGLPAGETLYWLTTPQGFAVFAADGSRTNPFEPGDGIFGSSDLDELTERIEDAVAFLERDGGAAGSAGSAAGRGGSGGSAGAGGTAGSAGSAAGSGGSSGSTAQDAGPAACPGELPFEPGATPAADPCPGDCFAVRGSPFDAANGCIDYDAAIIIGCIEGATPPIVACVERPEDGQRFQLGGGWPFPMSTVYRSCSTADTSTVVSAPACP